MNMTKRLEKLALIAGLIWLASLALDPLLMFWAMRTGGTAAAALAMSDIMPISLKNIVGGAVHIAVAVWLYQQAKRNGHSIYLWPLLGLVFGIMTVMVYLLAEIRDELKKDKSEIGIGSPIAEAPSHPTGLTDRVSGESAVQAGQLSKENQAE